MSNGQLTAPVSAQDHVAGPDTAPVTLVEYGDYQCPSCGMAFPVVQSLQQQLGARLRFVFRNFPLTDAHPFAEHAAETAEASAAQGKFWEMHDMLYEHQEQLRDEDLLDYAEQLGLDAKRVAHELTSGTYTRRVREDFRSGVTSGVNGTPTFFVNGERYNGNWNDSAEFGRMLREAADAIDAGVRA